MKRKNIVICAAVVIAFLVQLWRGFRPTPPEPEFIPSGAVPEPAGVVISAILTGLMVWALLEFLFWGYAKIKEKM